jgi:hypothetical protein
MQIADIICGNANDNEGSFLRYRSSSYLTEFCRDCKTDYHHHGSRRNRWVAEVLGKILDEPQPAANVPPDTFSRVI